MKKNMIFIVLGVVSLLAALLILSDGYRVISFRKERVITVGVFSDSYWEVQNGYSYRILEDAIALFEKQNPEVKVEFVSGILKADYPEWLAEQLMLGTAPDVFMVLGENFNDLAEIGVLKDLTDLMEQDASFEQDAFYSSALSSGLYEEKQYALPYECAPRLMFVNKTILDAEGVAVPEENWTWENFYEICQSVTKDTDGNGTTDQFGVVGYTWEDAFVANGAVLFNERGTECYFTDEKAGEAISFMEKLESLRAGYVVTEREFDLGRVAFQPMLFSEYRAYKPYPLSIKKYSGFEWECIPMPAGPEGSNRSDLDTLLVGMNEDTIHEKYAWEFMKLLTADEEIQSEIFDYSEGVSVIKEVTVKNSGFDVEVLNDAVENAVVTPRFRNYNAAVLEVERAVNDIIEGSSNISMEQIIWNRTINNFLKDNQINDKSH